MQSKPQYAFGYEVDDYYNQLSHGRWEIRDGDVVQGQYRVLLPDGRSKYILKFPESCNEIRWIMHVLK